MKVEYVGNEVSEKFYKKIQLNSHFYSNIAINCVKDCFDESIKDINPIDLLIMNGEINIFISVGMQIVSNLIDEIILQVSHNITKDDFEAEKTLLFKKMLSALEDSFYNNKKD